VTSYSVMDRSPGQSDAEVIARSAAEPAEFAHLVRAHRGRVLGYLTRRVGPTVAEDLAAETFLRAFRARESYQGVNGSALPWLFAIATNLLRSHVRSEQRRTATLGRFAGREIYEGGGHEHVDDALEAAATLQKLATTFAGLPDGSRDVLVLIAVEGMTYEEAAVALDVPVGTVRSRLSRARIELRRSLGAGGTPDLSDGSHAQSQERHQ
jgi:RNA polymerase sigma factor (sigma-70 family)